MSDETCEKCKHFVQHYAKKGKSGFMPIYEGHCMHPRLKSRRPGTPCEKFSLRKSDT